MAYQLALTQHSNTTFNKCELSYTDRSLIFVRVEYEIHCVVIASPQNRDLSCQ